MVIPANKKPGAIQILKHNDSLVIDLTGEYAFFPSISNSKSIRYKRYVGQKIGLCGKMLPYITNKKSHTDKLRRMTQEYTLACMKAKIFPPSYGQTKVHCWATLARPKGIWDVHNATKPIGDWLESVGLVDNDMSLEIWPVDTSRYDIFQDKDRSTLLLQPHESCKALNESFLLQHLRTAIKG